MNGETTAVVSYSEPRRGLVEGEPSIAEAEQYGSYEEATRGRPEYGRSDEPIEHGRVYRYRPDEHEADEKIREEAKRQAEEDVYRERIREELRRQGVGQEEDFHETLERLGREEEERMKKERMRKREEETEREKMKFERERLDALQQSQKLERQKMGFESREMRRKESGKVLQGIMKVATMGGPVKMSERTASLYGASGMRRLVAPPARPKPTLDKIREASYVGSSLRESHLVGGMQDVTRPTMGMRDLTTPRRVDRGAGYGRGDMARYVVPRTQRLKGLIGMQGISDTPIARASSLAGTRQLAKPMSFQQKATQTNETVYQRMRALTMGTGMNQTEQIAYAEIKGNHDADTRSHIIEELAKLGISKLEASRAVDGLLRQGLVRRGKSFNGEPVLEVAG